MRERVIICSLQTCRLFIHHTLTFVCVTCLSQSSQTMRMDSGSYPSIPSSALTSRSLHTSSSLLPSGLPPSSTLTSSGITSNSLTSQFQAPLSPSLVTASSVNNLDTVLRSQVYNYMNMQ